MTSAAAAKLSEELQKLANACPGTLAGGLLYAIAGCLEFDQELNGPCSQLFMQVLLPKIELLEFLAETLEGGQSLEEAIAEVLAD